MKILFREFNSHRREAWLILTGLALLWGFTFITWMDGNGIISQGMHPGMVILHFVLPISAGIFTVHWCPTWEDRFHCGAWMIIIYASLDMLVLAGWEIFLWRRGMLYPAGMEYTGLGEVIYEVLLFGLMVIVVGMLLAGLGAWLAWLVRVAGKRLSG
mgnify:CR=1 FL=1